MSYEVAAAFAEVLVSSGYRGAVSDAFEASPSTYLEEKIAAEGLIYATLQKRLPPQEEAWEMRRQAAVAELNGARLGHFASYIHRQGGINETEGLHIEDMEPGEKEIIYTNSRILKLRNTIAQPIDFLEAALDSIDGRKRQAINKQVVGPENYATALKFFTDKIFDFNDNPPATKVIKAQVDRCMRGFMTIGKKDAPNIVEMGNLYAAIKHLPKGSFDAKFTADILRFSLDQLPNYDTNPYVTNGNLNLMIAAMGKLDLSKGGEVAGTLIDLALRQGKKFETTSDYLFTLRAISGLPNNPAANRAFASFLAARNNLEQALDINDCDVANEHLANIATAVIDDPMLTQAAQKLALYNAMSAAELVRKQTFTGLGDERLAQLEQTARRIAVNARRI